MSWAIAGEAARAISRQAAWDRLIVVGDQNRVGVIEGHDRPVSRNQVGLSKEDPSHVMQFASRRQVRAGMRSGVTSQVGSYIVLGVTIGRCGLWLFRPNPASVFAR